MGPRWTWLYIFFLICVIDSIEGFSRCCRGHRIFRGLRCCCDSCAKKACRAAAAYAAFAATATTAAAAASAVLRLLLLLLLCCGCCCCCCCAAAELLLCCCCCHIRVPLLRVPKKICCASRCQPIFPFFDTRFVFFGDLNAISAIRSSQTQSK